MKLLSWKSVNREAMSPLLMRQHLSCEKMTLARVELKKGCYVPSHQHENEQISHVLEGALKFISEGKEYLVRAGEMLVIPSHAPHDALVLEDTTVLDIFAPARADWAQGKDQYLRAGVAKK